MDQITMVYLHNGILLSRKKEEAPTFHNSIGGTGHYVLSEIQAVKEKYHMMISPTRGT